jgi:CheY-like chemotaxis protein
MPTHVIDPGKKPRSEGGKNMEDDPKMTETVLVVDDEPDIQEILKAYLERTEGVEVVSALSGEAAVETYRELAESGDAPALVVMDLNLSGSNADQKIVDAHRRGEDDRLDGVRTAETILDIDGGAVIWGYTDWGDRLRDVGADRVVDRVVSFKKFAAMVIDHLQS